MVAKLGHFLVVMMVDKLELGVVAGLVVYLDFPTDNLTVEEKAATSELLLAEMKVAH